MPQRLTHALRPMLASKWDQVGKVSPPFLVSPKLDGCRCVATKQGLFTRNGHALHGLTRIKHALAPLFKNDPRLVLDGELFRLPRTQFEERENFELVARTVRKGLSKKKNAARNNTKAMQEQHQQQRLDPEQLSYFVFDVQCMARKSLTDNEHSIPIHFTPTTKNSHNHQLAAKRSLSGSRIGNSLMKNSVEINPSPMLVERRQTPFYARFAYLRRLFQRHGMACLAVSTYLRKRPLPPVVMVPQLPAYTNDDVVRIHRKLTDTGFEGSVIRSLANTYCNGMRSSTLLKLVDQHDAEFQVTKIGIDAENKSNSKKKGVRSSPAFVECITKKGSLFRAPIFGVRKSVLRRWASQKHDYLGMFATVRFMRLNRNGVPRNAVFKSIRGHSGWTF